MKTEVKLLLIRRQKYYTGFMKENSHDQRKLFRCAKTQFAQKSDLSFQEYGDGMALANNIGKLFVQKIDSIRTKIDEATISFILTPLQSLNNLLFARVSFSPSLRILSMMSCN